MEAEFEQLLAALDDGLERGRLMALAEGRVVDWPARHRLGSVDPAEAAAIRLELAEAEHAAAARALRELRS